MPHIRLPQGIPGIRGLFEYRPDTARPMSELANILLHEPNTLSAGERELIATYVSSENDCEYCQSSHGATAAYHLGGKDDVVSQVKRDFHQAPISDKLKGLLTIAGKVQKGGKNVLAEDIERARGLGATDGEIHDTVLIAAAFCMFNRYVDGLATLTPEDPGIYRERAPMLAREGYVRIPPSTSAQGTGS
jgi:uncharacterized peroxidase-related enzyme